MKVPLTACRLTKRADFSSFTKAVSESLPYYQSEGDGYVHCVKEVTMHYDRDTAKLTHISVSFWCGGGGFLYPSSVSERVSRRGGRKPAAIVAEPSAGRVVCATCAGRAVGSGQHGNHKIGDNFVKFRPHKDFIATRRLAGAA